MEAPAGAARPPAWRPGRDWFDIACLVLSACVASVFFARLGAALAGAPYAFWESMLVIGSALVGVALLVLAILRRSEASGRRTGSRTWAWNPWLLLAGAASFVAALALDTSACAAWRAQPTVDALHAFEAEHGAPPARLEELVPHHLLRPCRSGSRARSTVRNTTGTIGLRADGGSRSAAMPS